MAHGTPLHRCPDRRARSHNGPGAHPSSHPNSGDPEALLWPGRVLGSHLVAFDRVLDIGSFRPNYLGPAVAAEGLDPIRFHDLRHTFASLALAAGFQPYEVSRWLGHANLATTDAIYAHLYPSDYSSHLDRFSAFVASEAVR